MVTSLCEENRFPAVHFRFFGGVQKKNEHFLDHEPLTLSLSNVTIISDRFISLILKLDRFNGQNSATLI